MELLCIVHGCSSAVRGYMEFPISSRTQVGVCLIHGMYIHDCKNELEDLVDCLARQGVPSPITRWDDFASIRDARAVVYLTRYYAAVMETLEIFINRAWEWLPELLDDIDMVYDNLERLITQILHVHDLLIL